MISFFPKESKVICNRRDLHVISVTMTTLSITFDYSSHRYFVIHKLYEKIFISTIVAYTIIHWIKLFILIYYDYQLSKWIVVNMSTLYMHILHGRVWWRFTIICPDVTEMKALRVMRLSVIYRPIPKAKDGGSRN